MKLTLSSLLFVVAAVALWLTLGLGQTLPRIAASTPEQLITTYLDTAEIVRFDKTGEKQEALTVVRAKQYSDANVYYLEGISATNTSATSRPWRLQAQRGQYHHDTATLELQENVIVDDLKNRGQLVTEALTLKPNQHLALTDAPVVITGNKTITTAVGMLADWEEEHIALHHEVETRYAR